MATNHRPLASTEEVSAFMQIPVTTLHQWRHKGVGPRSAKVGRWIRYRWEDVEAWLAEQSRDGSREVAS